MEPNEYRAIAAWGKLLSSHHYYVVEQQELAAKEGAPVDALYRRTYGGGWVCLSDLQEKMPTTVARLIREYGVPGHQGKEEATNER